MEFVTCLQNATRKIRTSIDVSPSISVCSRSVRETETVFSANPSKIRLNVLRRDRYRCKRCGQTGDEVTLDVLRTGPEASSIEAMITLCAHCRDLVEQWQMTEHYAIKSLQRL